MHTLSSILSNLHFLSMNKVKYKAEALSILILRRALTIPEKRVLYVVSIVAYQDYQDDVDLTKGFSHMWD